MENDSKNNLATIMKQRLKELIEENEKMKASNDKKAAMLSAVIKNGFEVYGELTAQLTDSPSGLSVTKTIIKTNEKLIAKLVEEVNKAPPILELEALSLDVPNECYGPDEFTMKTYAEIEAEIKNVKEKIANLKQNMVQAAEILKAKRGIGNEHKEIEEQCFALREVNWELEKDIRKAIWQWKKANWGNFASTNFEKEIQDILNN